MSRVVSIALLIAALAAAAGITYDPSAYGPDEPLRRCLHAAGIPLPGGFIPEPRIEIYKTERKLLLFSRDLLVKTYRIQLGSKDPLNDRERARDGRTPEGAYTICGHHPTSRYLLGLYLDYPNAQDVEAGLERGVLTEEDADRVREAHERGRCPIPFDTGLGGPMLIHGQHPEVTARLKLEQEGELLREGLHPGDLDPAALRESSDWTLGCIGMTNPDIRELYELIPNGTPVFIYGERDLAPGAESGPGAR
ncbi:MAG: L,D-transpeptidase [Candidatus Eisenbacteria bacterium]